MKYLYLGIMGFIGGSLLKLALPLENPLFWILAICYLVAVVVSGEFAFPDEKD